MGFLDTDRRIYALAFARMADSIGNSFLIVVLPLYITSGVVSGGTFGLTPAIVTGVILSAFGFFNSAVQPFVGNLSDRTGKRRAFVIAGLLVLTVANFTYSLVSSYDLVFVVRIAQGVGVALTIPATIALVNELSDDAARGGSMGVFNTFRMLGFGLGPIIAGGMVHGGPYRVAGVFVSGFQAAFYVAALGSLIGAGFVYLLVSDPEAEDVDVDAGSDLSIAVLDRRDGRILDSVFTLGLASLFMAVGVSIVSPLEAQVNAALDQSATMFGVEFAAFIFAQVLLQAPIGSWSDRYGRKPFIVAGLLLLVPATLVQGFVTTTATMILARFVQGIAGAAVFAPGMALAGDIARGRSSGTTLSVLTMAFGLGTAIGPLAGGALADVPVPVGQSYVAPFFLGAALALLGAFLVRSQVHETVGSGDAANERSNVDPSAAD